MYFASGSRRLNARRYVRNRLLNDLLRRLLTSSVHFSSPQKAIWLFGDPLSTAPEQKTKSAKTAQPCGFSAFKTFDRFLTCFMFKKNNKSFSIYCLYARSSRLFRQSHRRTLVRRFLFAKIKSNAGKAKSRARPLPSVPENKRRWPGLWTAAPRPACRSLFPDTFYKDCRTLPRLQTRRRSAQTK